MFFASGSSRLEEICATRLALPPPVLFLTVSLKLWGPMEMSGFAALTARSGVREHWNQVCHVSGTLMGRGYYVILASSEDAHRTTIA
jgi:hypothetical protein